MGHADRKMRRAVAKTEKPSLRGDVLLFGSLVQNAPAGGVAPGGAKRRPNLETRTLNDRRTPYHGAYPLRGRWLSDDYVGLRNAAWAVRNSRTGANFNPLALRLVLAEAERLVCSGEPLLDILEAFAELLMRP